MSYVFRIRAAVAGVVCSLAVAACGDRATLPVAVPDPAVPGGPAASGTSSNTGRALYVAAHSNAQSTADQWRASRPTDAAQMDKIAAQPQATWFGNWNSDIASAVNAVVQAASAVNAVPVLVAYNIPFRDCGGLSGGNATAASSYANWIADFASGIGGRSAIVILEPDALAGIDCLSAGDQQTRLSLLGQAVHLLASASTSVYLDAGNPNWQPATTMAARLVSANIAEAAGFSLNTSNFYADADNVRYGNALSALVGGKHYVIDSSRNGLGPAAGNPWCNPDGRALGRKPTTDTGEPLVDAFLWIKAPGESDGACNGAPAAGTWMPDYALGLAQRAAY